MHFQKTTKLTQMTKKPENRDLFGKNLLRRNICTGEKDFCDQVPHERNLYPSPVYIKRRERALPGEKP